MKKQKPKEKKEIDKSKKSSAILNDINRGGHKEIPESIQSAEVLMDNRFKRRKTILTNRQVTILTTLDVLAQLYDIPFLKKWVDCFAEWRTSGDKGRGRSDITDIFKFSSLHQTEKAKELLSLIRRD